MAQCNKFSHDSRISTAWAPLTLCRSNTVYIAHHRNCFFLVLYIFIQTESIVMYRGGQHFFFWGCAFHWSATIYFKCACASSLPFQICQCAMRYSAIAEASATCFLPLPSRRLSVGITLFAEDLLPIGEWGWKELTG